LSFPTITLPRVSPLASIAISDSTNPKWNGAKYKFNVTRTGELAIHLFKLNPYNNVSLGIARIKLEFQDQASITAYVEGTAKRTGKIMLGLKYMPA
ncbi:hypothetical protein GMORB2_4948, partial [Geosmithia morbida]